MSVAGRIHSTIRNTKRMTEIVGVLVRHGFHGAVSELKLGEPGKGPTDETALATVETRLSVNERLRQVLEDLGPVFVKLGQVLSTRPDLIPADMADEFRKLQIDAAKVPFEEIQQRLEEEYNGQVEEHFASIDPTPIGAASMAQVHRAMLHDGTRVVVKILRPGIEPIIEADMEILREIAKFSERYFEAQSFSPVDVVREFAKQLSREIDLSIEARSTQRLRQQFEDDPNVFFAHVHREHSTRRVLVMEEVHGTLLSKLDLDSLTAAQRRTIVERGVDAVYRMCLDQYFFHADPHPGNIFIVDDERLCFIDCGMTGLIEPRTAGQLAQLVQAVVEGDTDTVIHITLDLSGADPSLQFDRKFRTDVSSFIAEFRIGDGSFEDLQLGAMLLALFELLRLWRIRCPSDVVFLLKALVTIEGVGRQIDPSFDLVAHVKPMLQRRIMRRYSFREVRRRVIRSMAAYVDIIEDLPRELRALTAVMHRKDFAINLHHEGLDRLSDTMDRASRTIAYGLVLASVILSSAILILADRGTTGFLTSIGFAVLAILGAVAVGLALINFWRVRRGAKRRRSR